MISDQPGNTLLTREKFFFSVRNGCSRIYGVRWRKKKSKVVFPARKENFISHRSFSPGLFRRADLTRSTRKKGETSVVVTARFPRLIRDKARTGQGRPLNTFARFPRVNATLPRFVSEYQNLSRFYKPFNISPVFRSAKHSLLPLVPFLEKRIRTTFCLPHPFFVRNIRKFLSNFFFPPSFFPLIKFRILNITEIFVYIIGCHSRNN